ncbi:acyl-CoA-binding domain-containing protein 5A isoform X7 [Esox lucius]|uniref:acyl-CoA-binding domain-containing protein 5A isoform X7 n=1 Tax=Esox lucius TaxID=8010 RepID=UPI001476D6D6|nr:acyl-CoA-binding domain-containing protein 5A isoform X7 [Esox lucius]
MSVTFSCQIPSIWKILETLPVTEEVSDLLEALGGVFFEEVEGGVQEEERPYAVAAEQMQTGFIQKPKMEGFGSLEIWADIQTKVPERKSNSMVMVGKEESKEGMKEARKLTEEEKVDCDEEEDSDDEEEDDERGTTAERKHPGPNRSRLRMEDPRCGSEVSSSNGSMEPSVSSVTYGTHSSLNSEEEEEELAYSKQPLPENRFQHLNGHLSEHLRATESDNEEFCDSIEHLVMEEESAVPRVHSSGRRASEAKRSLQRETNLNMDEDLSLLEDSPNREGLHTERRDSCWSMSGIGSRSSGLGSGSQLCTNENAAERWVMQSSTEAAASGDLNDYIAGVLTRLQEDMANVLQRLNTLEALTTIQTRSLSQARQNDSLSIARERPSWWPFHLCPATLVFSTVWPLIAHWLVQIYLQRRSRKMS